MRILALILAAATLLAAGASGVLPDETALETIRVEDLKSELYFLASDELRGRALRTPYNDLTARYLARRFEEMGLRPAAGESYFQEFELVDAALGAPNRCVVRPAGGRRRVLDLEDDFVPAPLSANGRIRAPLVLAGFGISAPELGHDDYRGLDVRGKVVMILEDEPGERDPSSRFDGLVDSEYGRELHKLASAQRHGAAGVLFAPDPLNHRPVPLSRAASRLWPENPAEARPQLRSGTEKITIPAAYLSRERAEQLVGLLGLELEQWQKLAEKGRRPRRRLRAVEVELEVNLTREAFTARNVLALMPGADPRLRDEVVVIGAHFDHVGEEGDEVFYGADDNASGTVGLLEIAEAYAASSLPPRRSVLFAAFNAEERGLLGSYHYVEQPVFPLQQTVAMFQMDMIGRDEEIPERKGYRFRGLESQSAESNRNAVNLLGYSRSRDLKEIARSANQSVGLELRFRYDNHRIGLLRRSDNWPFLARGIPALFFHTGLHPDYHRPTDTADKINFEKLAKVVRLVYASSWHAANSDDRPRFQAFGGERR